MQVHLQALQRDVLSMHATAAAVSSVYLYSTTVILLHGLTPACNTISLLFLSTYFLAFYGNHYWICHSKSSIPFPALFTCFSFSARCTCVYRYLAQWRRPGFKITQLELCGCGCSGHFRWSVVARRVLSSLRGGSQLWSKTLQRCLCTACNKNGP